MPIIYGEKSGKFCCVEVASQLEGNAGSAILESGPNAETCVQSVRLFEKQFGREWGRVRPETKFVPLSLISGGLSGLCEVWVALAGTGFDRIHQKVQLTWKNTV